MKEEEYHIAWCRQHFAMLANHGVWGVSRSGLLFQKRGSELFLTARMPHDEDMPITPEQLHEQQQADFEIIRDKFAAAGIIVKDLSQ